MIRSFKYRLSPTKAQAASLERHLSLCCELYNAALQERRDAWQKQRIRVTKFDQYKALPGLRKVRPDLSEIGSTELRGVLNNLDKSFSNFFRRCKTEGKPGYPRFKNRKRYSTLLIDDLPKSPIVAGGRRISIPLLGKIKIRMHRPLEGAPKALRLKKEGDGHWYAILACVDVPRRLLLDTGKSIGVDLGISSLVALSDGTLIPNLRFAEQARLRLERAQRKIARRVRGSHRRRKAIAAFRRLQFHVVEQRKQYAIDIANRLVRGYDTICVEKLNVKGLAGGVLAKQVHDASWSTLLHWIDVKAESAGRQIVQVDPRGTSQRCSACSATVRKDLSVRVHNCPSCGHSADRDVNAACNVLSLGLSVRGAAAAVGAQL